MLIVFSTQEIDGVSDINIYFREVRDRMVQFKQVTPNAPK